MKISISSLSELSRVADAVIERLNGRNVVAFRAPMGAGKTTLIAEIVAALGSGDVVTSPTFALVNEYKGESISVFHFDMYRIESEDELYSIGFYDYLERKGICLVEWSENIEEYLPDEYLRVEIVKDSQDNTDSRKITVSKN